jgi:sigma-B regulation protein RsbU (phosphoserine phosphatase)
MDVLVVDDNPLFQKLMLKWVAAMGHAPSVAVDGAAALERVREGGVDVVVSDMMMPGMSGIELCRALKEEWGEARPRFFLITAETGTDIRESAREAGVDVFLAKPLDRSELGMRLDRPVR